MLHRAGAEENENLLGVFAAGKVLLSFTTWAMLSSVKVLILNPFQGPESALLKYTSPLYHSRSSPQHIDTFLVTILGISA